MTYKVAAFYHFVRWPHYAALKEPLLELCKTHHICGTILLAHEGINGTIAGHETHLDAWMQELIHGDLMKQSLLKMDIKYSTAKQKPFAKMKVRLKKEIVALGCPEINPAMKAGTYVEPKDWNALIEDPEMIMLDTRNSYEVEIGTFKNAIDPKTRIFKEFKKYVSDNLDPEKNKKVAMFCTGGIRCEKASAYMLEQGFEEVFHLKGGILKYLEEIPKQESHWNGACFVFDERIALDHGLEERDDIKEKGQRLKYDTINEHRALKEKDVEKKT